jgi:hypothetical protein
MAAARSEGNFVCLPRRCRDIADAGARALFALLALALLGFGFGSCGSSDTATGAKRAADQRRPTHGKPSDPTGSSVDRPDHDGDGDAHAATARSFFDEDDSERHFGHAARVPEARVVAALVERYYTAAAAHDGARACALLDGGLAAAFAQERSGGNAATGAGACAAVVEPLLAHSFQWSTAQAARLQVREVRIADDQGLALVDVNSDDREILVQREGSAWKMAGLFDSEVR